MAELHRVEINEKAPSEIEPEKETNTESEELPQEQSDRPEWLPEKFKSPEDMSKAYSELEKKLGQSPEEGTEEPEQVEEKAEDQEEQPQDSGEEQSQGEEGEQGDPVVQQAGCPGFLHHLECQGYKL